MVVAYLRPPTRQSIFVSNDDKARFSAREHHIESAHVAKKADVSGDIAARGDEDDEITLTLPWGIVPMRAASPS
jgi:hypothetical protein